jgi:hypothetical protein
MNVFIDPSNKEKYLALTEPTAKQFRALPENLFTEVCTSPLDSGQVRIVHGWTKDSQWWNEARFPSIS